MKFGHSGQKNKIWKLLAQIQYKVWCCHGVMGTGLGKGHLFLKYWHECAPMLIRVKYVPSHCPVWAFSGSMQLSTFTVLQNCSLVYVGTLYLAYLSRSPGVGYQQQGEKVSFLISGLWCIIETSESGTLPSLGGWSLNASLLVEVLSSGSKLLCSLAVARSNM